METKQPVQIINPTSDNYVYAFTFSGCIYESSYTTISLHRTRKGAANAMKKFKEEQKRDFIETYGEEYAKNNNYDYACGYDIEKIEILE